MIRFVNLTPHDIVVRLDSGKDLIIPRSGQVARLKTFQAVEYPWGEDMPALATSTLEGIDGLPGPEDGVIYIASTLVAQAAARYGRRDVVSPDTGPGSAIRDESGQIVAVRRLQQFL